MSINSYDDAKKALKDIASRLDEEYYEEMEEEEEYEKNYEELYPEVVTEVAKKAAEFGVVEGMHLYGELLSRKAARCEETNDSKDLLQEAKQWVRKAADGGCWGAMEDMGGEADLDQSEIELYVYSKLASNDPDKFSESMYDLSDDQVKEANETYEAILSEMKAKGVKRSSYCSCKFV